MKGNGTGGGTMEKSGGVCPKIDALPGSLHVEWKQCGKTSCRCTTGELHGPYWYRRWREGGRPCKAYVARSRVPEVAAALARWRGSHPPTWAMRQALVELRRFEKEVL